MFYDKATTIFLLTNYERFRNVLKKPIWFELNFDNQI